MTSLSLHLPKPNLCLCCTPSPFYNWHSNTSEMKYWHLAPVTLHNNTYCIPHTSLSTAAAGCACVRGWKRRGVKKKGGEKTRRKGEKEIWSVRQQHCRCICPVGVDLQLFTPLSAQSLANFFVFFRPTSRAGGMGACANRCVAGSPMRKLIDTPSALTPAAMRACVRVCVCSPVYAALFFAYPPGHAACAPSEALSWAQAFNFSGARMPVNLTSGWPRWCQCCRAAKPRLFFFFLFLSFFFFFFFCSAYPQNDSAMNSMIGMGLN